MVFNTAKNSKQISGAMSIQIQIVDDILYFFYSWHCVC